MRAAVIILMILGMEVETAPTERDRPSSLIHLSSAVPDKSSVLNLSQHLKRYLLSTKAAELDGTTKTTIAAGTRDRRMRTNPETAGPDRKAQMLKMISALEELHKTFNNTLNSRLTILPRANGRNSGRKKEKVISPAEGGLKSTTVPPASADSTASRASADANIPSLTGRNFKKSLPPQNKKTNKRVCFWKYCSQN